MQKMAKIFIGSTILMSLSFTVFSIAYAQNPTPTPIDTNKDYTVLTPLPGTTNCEGKTPTSVTIDPATGNSTGGCQTNFSNYLPALFNFAIGIAGALAFIYITIGGIMYMTSDAIGGKSAGKEYINNALWGLLLVIGAWVILFTINPKLLQFNLNLTQPTTIVQDTVVSGSNPISSGGAVATGADLLSGATLAADTANRNTLASENVQINNPPCTASRNTHCTDVDLLTPSIVSGLGTLQSAVCSGKSSCSIIVTGGDEGSLHNTGTTHGNGSTVDLSPTSTLNNYLGSSNPTNGTKVTKNGMTFTYEAPGANAANTGAHWHTTQP